MLKVIVIAVVLVVVAAAAIVALAWWRWNGAIESDIQRLMADAGGEATIVDDVMLAPLPAPVQRHLRFAGVVGKPIPLTVWLTQRGRIRSAADASWMNLEATQYYSTEPPQFVWKASFPTQMMPVVLGRDAYLDGQGSMVMKMLSLYPVADESDGAMNDASLMRYLNEMMWFPAAFLGDNVSFAPIDDTSANVTIRDRGMSATATMVFDAEGRLVNFRASRFNTATRAIEAWETPMAAYGEFAGLRLPSKGSAVWSLADGDFAYIELEIVTVEYDP